MVGELYAECGGYDRNKKGRMSRVGMIMNRRIIKV